MLMRNYSPFPNLRFVGSDADDREFGVVLVKATYVVSGERLEIAAEQAPVLLDDEYHDASSSLWMPSDFVARKPRTDIVLDAVARAPGGKPSRAWTCGVGVEDGAAPFLRRLDVCGPRRWDPSWSVGKRGAFANGWRRALLAGWTLSEPDPVTTVPIRYELAYGGCIRSREKGRSDEIINAYERNPVGIGWSHPDAVGDEPVPAPQIVDAATSLLAPGSDVTVAGFGPIPPHWLPRRLLAGTLDEEWQRSRWPSWPSDYDFAYNNSANPGMVFPGYLQGGETLVLEHLGPEARRRIGLPGHRPLLAIDGAHRSAVPMTLDTLFLDVDDEDAAEHRVFITWRKAFDLSSTTTLAIVFDERSRNAPAS